jgi:hypothetical protein
MNRRASNILSLGILLALLATALSGESKLAVADSAGSTREIWMDRRARLPIAADAPRGSVASSQASAARSCLPRYSEPEHLLTVVETSPTDYEPNVMPADLNGDGLEDVVINRQTFQTYETYELGILLNDENGGLELATPTVFSGTVPEVQNPTQVVIADFNGDRVDDIFVADHGYDAHPFPGYQNTLVLSAPGGKLVDATANLPQQYDFSHSAAAGDIDGDGDQDLYVGNIWGQNPIDPQILLNDGSGKFTIGEDRLHVSLDLAQNAYTACKFVDVNRDGFLDLVLGDAGDVSNGEYSTLHSVVLLNDGEGSFDSSPVALPEKPFDATDIGLGIQPLDLNADSYQDLVIAYTKGVPSYVGRYIQVLINNRDGTFRDETSTRLPQSDNYDPYIHRLYLRDLDRDGDMDLIAKQEDWRDADPLLFVNDGSGSFIQQPLHFGVGYLYYAFLDLDGDGGHDLVVASSAPPEEIYAVRDLGCPVFLPLVCRNYSTVD